MCFLDAKQAFDHVWHDCLFVFVFFFVVFFFLMGWGGGGGRGGGFKLHELGIDLYIWKAIVSLHDNVTSYVFSRGF